MLPGQAGAPGMPSTDSAMARERANFRTGLAGTLRRNIVSAANAMPADKYGFAPSVGKFRGVRSFGAEVRHLAATNYILAAAAQGQAPPADAGDEEGPKNGDSPLAHRRITDSRLRPLRTDGRLPQDERNRTTGEPAVMPRPRLFSCADRR